MNNIQTHKVFITNRLDINHQTKTVRSTAIYRYYHPACWNKQKKTILTPNHKYHYDIREVETIDREILDRPCDLCEVPLDVVSSPIRKKKKG